MSTSLLRFLRTALLLMQPFLALGCSKPPQSVQAVPGTAVSLAPPSGFIPATNFTGFVSENGEASILIAELPGRAGEAVSKLFADEDVARLQFASQGVRVEHMEWLTVEGHLVPVAVGTQDAYGRTFGKWMALLSTSPVIMITVQAPTDHALTHKEAMAALASVKLRLAASLEEKLADLPFTVAPQAPFRILEVLGGSSVVLTAGELDTDPEGRQPLVVIASQLSLPFSSDDLAVVSDQLIAGSRRIQDGTIVSRQDIVFAGIKGQRVDGRMPDGGTYQHYLALWPGDRFVRLVAILPAGASAETQGAVDAIVASTRFRD
ncbi:hypothetical protein DBR33_03330 [Stenotrophomonas sp. HMWF022]|uniref:hypothetical protein n=1 Tax=Stenotrophomonas sp. HMWF023 TaxID=2056859 RepID=UPI000D3816D5|nr:hypothetical protein [Stenotrophomonas sp. HMWF023]PTS73358.1 hypothetical protein DBR20_15910 [Stenotrophomonas sp. HMWF023]PTT55522.1 hypothetical protein DBR33_03330 [Stenotrophomonas sp. HMWF022]